MNSDTNTGTSTGADAATAPGTPDFAGWTCPRPLRDYPRIVTGHGGGGRLSAELIEHLFVPAFADQDPDADRVADPGAGAGSDARPALHDSFVLDVPAGRLAVSTDSYVVDPIIFPGGSLGDLAVNGTVNDVAMSGAQPLALTAGFILDEGLPMETLGRIVNDMAAAARAAGVRIVTGDTKVVEARSGAAPGLFVNTAGIGLVPDGVRIAPERATPGDVVIVSGPMGVHGIAIMSVREGLEFGTTLATDSAPLNGLVADMLAAHPDLHVLRDPTRGGLTASLCEIATAAMVGIEFEETAVPVPPEVAAACSFLGLDPFGVANEGKLVAIVPPDAVEVVMDALAAHPLGKEAAVIGRVVDDHPGMVAARTPFGARRVVDMPLGEQLPRIC
ncbi:MAG: hydrogenase expression/formation protein HypE [Acidimicrobiia bacterium]|nr:hydrogenase expression/formation protein HypE [Acidimicrobiia bacterium]